MLRIFALMSVILLPLSSAASARDLSELLQGTRSLCGIPQLIAGNQQSDSLGDNRFLLTDNEGLIRTFSSDNDTYSVFKKIAAPHIIVCVPVDAATDIGEMKIIPAAWFYYWSISGSGVSVSNQFFPKPRVAPTQEI